MKSFSHINEQGKAQMVDVGEKLVQQRMARASGFIRLNHTTVSLIRENHMKKGDVLTVAQIAGIQAAKRTADLIPLCHPLQITKVDVQTNLKDDGVEVQTLVKCNGQTGVEMEALTAASIALLTVYDMCKAVDKEMVIQDVVLLEKKKE
ncbi:MAG: cyclic pyranopterin monophosphate synthase MoaC [Bacteroidales bacterium]|jgi:cyclic pyranopterin phosphate synthase|nr:cyclic pyranopterin monophosphate synthase MoaC [Bacteroidales bacterium]NLM93687.1 cyclic pyranopterin monophosphate synthase MoaC [Bacteroidales bacterium]